MKIGIFRSGFAAVVMLLTSAIADDAARPVAVAPPDDDQLCNRVVLIGASVSAGFTQAELFGGPKTAGYRLKHYFDAAIQHDHAPTETFGGSFFFMNPEKSADACIQKALAAEPSLVVAIDFLFWFCYGDNLTAEQRLRLFEKGLTFLERLDSPLVVGDIPHAAAAVDKMLAPGQLPPENVIDRCNARLAEWAERRGRVSVIPLRRFLDAATTDQPLSIRSHRWDAGTTRSLLQQDNLHPSHEGCAGLTLLALDAALQEHGSVSAQWICWDLHKVYADGLKASQPQPNESPGGTAEVESAK